MYWKITACLAAAAFLFGECAFPVETPPPPAPQLDTPPEASQSGARWMGTHFEDVPVPSEFTLDYEVSYVDASARGPRIADLRYTGNFEITKFLMFVQPAMTKAGWRLDSLTGAAIKTLRFVKGTEECVMVIHRGHDGRGPGSVLMARLHPHAGT